MKLLTLVFFVLSAPTALAQSQSTVPVFPHQANFLAPYCLSHVFPGMNNAERQACLSEHKQRNTHFYVYPYNENDYKDLGAPSFDFYQDPATFRSRLQEIVDEGMAPVVWLFPDDAPSLHRNTSITEYRNILSNLIPVIDDSVSSYVLGLELDEYFTDAEIDTLGVHLNSLTDKKIGLHFTRDRTTGIENTWADYLVYQYGFGNSESQMRTETQAALDIVYGQFGKTLVAGEYAHGTSTESDMIQLGDSAIAVDPIMKLSGFGNGGTPLEINAIARPKPPGNLQAASSN